MFTLDQIKSAHSKVKSGADFPAYIQDLIQLGVHRYETFVSDGHTNFYDEQGTVLQSEAKYNELQVATESNQAQFISDLKNHQQGNTDYPTFCADCAKAGVEKWLVDTSKMTCTYLDGNEKEILIEAIPTV